MTKPMATLRFVTLGLGLLVMVLFGNFYDIHDSKGFDSRYTDPFVHPKNPYEDKPARYLTSISSYGVGRLFLGIIFLLLISLVWTALLLMNLVPAEDEAVTKIDAAYHVIGGTILFIWALLFLIYDAFCPLINSPDELKYPPIKVRCHVLKPCSPMWRQPLPVLPVPNAPAPVPPPCYPEIDPSCKTTMPTCIWYVANVLAGFVILVDGVLWIVMGWTTSRLSMAPISGLKGVLRIVVIILTLLVMGLTFYSYEGARETLPNQSPASVTIPFSGRDVPIIPSVNPLPDRRIEPQIIYGGTRVNNPLSSNPNPVFDIPIKIAKVTASLITGFLILSIIWTVLLMLEVVESKQGDAACHLVAGILIFLAHVWYIVHYAVLLSDYWTTPCEKIDWEKTLDKSKFQPELLPEEISYVKAPFNHHCAWAIVDLVAGVLGLIDGIICIVFAFL